MTDAELTATVRELLARVAQHLKAQLATSPGVGFAFFLELPFDVGIAYASSAERQGVVETVDEWLARASVATDGRVSMSVTSTTAERERARIALEALCSTLGKDLARSSTRFVLMLFDEGPPGAGHLAWFSTCATRTDSAAILTRWRKGMRKAARP